MVGLWLNRADVENSLQSLKKKKDKLQILKLQINFRHKVLGQSHFDSSVFKFSKNRKQHSVDRLKENLFKLLSAEDTLQRPVGHIPQPPEGHVPSTHTFLIQPQLLVGQRIQHRFEEQGSEELAWYDGLVLRMLDATSKEYEVIYDDEEDVCCFQLLDDLVAGDLIVISDTN